MIYLWLLLFTLTGPLLYSFDRRVHFARSWPALSVGIVFTAAYFLIWDEWFTRLGVWGFNPRYLLGWYIFSLPVEEVLFFFVVPFACVFLYEIMNYYVSRDILGGVGRRLSGGLAILLIIAGIYFHHRAYTATTFLLCSVWLGLHGFYWRAPYLGRFYVGYAISLIPFAIVNGVLTGTALAEPVVWYNNDENLGIRLSTIPVEDAIYLLLLLLSVITVFEARRKRAPARSLKPQS